MSPARVLSHGSTPTAVLVHGAFEDASGWAGVIAQLQLAGVPVVACANPLRGLASDARYIAGVTDEIDGPALLVGHSYGGAVITVAGSVASNVLGLVYVTAFALDEGESVLEVGARFPNTRLNEALRPGVCLDVDGHATVELCIDEAAFPRLFAADVPGVPAAVAAAAQRPVAARAFEDRASAAAWKALRCWYIVTTKDRVIDPAAQRFMAARAGARTIEVAASHAVAVSQPALVANQIREAVLAARRIHPTATTSHQTPPATAPTESDLP
jgi:pimeloyl-ACP methyl ester carboxylesterase